MKKTILIGQTARRGRVTIDVELRETPRGPELSMCGNVWLPSGRDIESGGQNYEHIREDVATFAVDAAKLDRMLEIWERWHLNGMNAGCEHQRANWGDISRKVEVVSYGITHEAQRLRNTTRGALASMALRGYVLELTETERALAELDDWFKVRHTAPDADSPLSGCYEVKKRETKTINWVYPSEHPEGILCKPCEVCGYKYGSEWRFEAIPADVLAEVEAW